ncbi:MAG TPA: type II secretion system protein [Chloroflexi bacterium]|nr:type II secretion system protein [Chloroflexota bacterium]
MKQEAGASLVEILVAVAIVGIALVVLVAALSTGAFAVRSSSRLTTATNLTASQLESIKAAAYDAVGAYPLVAAPPGYAVVVSTDVITTGLQQVTVTVSYQGETLVVMGGYKVDR